MDAEDVRVEFGWVTFSETKSDAFALRIAVAHSSRSCSLAALSEYLHEHS